MSDPVRLPRSVLKERRAELVAVLKSFHVARAGVFGSTARGEGSDHSDLDLIVEFAAGAERDLIGLTDALEAVAGISVDVVDAESVLRRAEASGIGVTILRDTVPL